MMKIYTKERNGDFREVPIEVVQWINKCHRRIEREA